MRFTLLRAFCCTAVMLLWGTASAHANPISFSIGTCVSGDCLQFQQAGGGSVDAELLQLSSNQLQITVSAALIDLLTNNPYVQDLGFNYEPGQLGQVTLESFTALGGSTVTTPTFNSKVGSFTLDFGFDFQNSNNGGRFDAGETVRIVINTENPIDLTNFTFAAAKVGGVGQNGANSVTLVGEPGAPLVPEPATLLLLGAALVPVARMVRRRRTD